MNDYLNLAKDVLKKLELPSEGELEELTNRIYDPEESVIFAGSVERKLYHLRKNIADGIKKREDVNILKKYADELEKNINYLKWD